MPDYASSNYTHHEFIRTTYKMMIMMIFIHPVFTGIYQFFPVFTWFFPLSDQPCTTVSISAAFQIPNNFFTPTIVFSLYKLCTQGYIYTKYVIVLFSFKIQIETFSFYCSVMFNKTFFLLSYRTAFQHLSHDSIYQKGWDGPNTISGKKTLKHRD